MTLLDDPPADPAQARAQRRWRVTRAMITVPTMISRLQRSRHFALARETELAAKRGLAQHSVYLKKLSLNLPMTLAALFVVRTSR